MPRFAANLSFLYTELPFLDRFAAAAADGFSAVEFLFPYAWSAQSLRERLDETGLQQVLFNVPPAGFELNNMAAAWDQGSRGTAALPGREAEFRAGMEQAFYYADTLKCPNIHVMAGLVDGTSTLQDVHATYEANLRWAAGIAEGAGVTLLIEPLNGRDMPGYFLNRQAQAHALVEAIESPNLKVQMDLYHCQVSEGDVTSKLHQYLPTGRVGHIQIASVPRREEPDRGELNYPYLFECLDTLGYQGWVGCEYRPHRGPVPGATTAGLDWLRPWQ